MTHRVCAQAGHRLEIDMTKPCPYCERDKLLLRISLLEHKLAAAEAELAENVADCQRWSEQVQTLGERVIAAEADAAKLREPAVAFVRKLDVIHADPQYQSLWVLTANRGMPYTGPNYSGELQSLRHALGLDAAMQPHAGGSEGQS